MINSEYKDSVVIVFYQSFFYNKDIELPVFKKNYKNLILEFFKSFQDESKNKILNEFSELYANLSIDAENVSFSKETKELFVDIFESNFHILEKNAFKIKKKYIKDLFFKHSVKLDNDAFSNSIYDEYFKNYMEKFYQ